MSDGDEADGIAGLSTAEAVDVIVEDEDDLDPNAVESALQPVTRNGVVSAGAAEAAIAETAKIVSTPETRLELAALALDEAREAAAPVEDVDAVRARLSGFESRLSAIEERVRALGEGLQGLAGRDLEDGSLFAVAREIGRIREAANELQYAADELQGDVESFERWLDDPAVRREELSADLDALGESLTGLEETLTAVAERVERAAHEPAADAEGGDPGESWVEAAVGHRVTGLLVADVRAELADVRALAGQLDQGDPADPEEPADPENVPSTADVEARLDDITDRRAAIGDRVEALARPVWRDRFEERLAAVEEVLGEHEPPVDWGALQVALEDAQ